MGGVHGEPVVIWEDMRVGDMIRTAKSRGMLFRILGPWREPDEKPIVNVKGSKTQLLNRVNIVRGRRATRSSSGAWLASTSRCRAACESSTRRRTSDRGSAASR